MMLNQAKSDRTQLVRLFDISEEQEKYVVNSPEGYGLMVFGDTHSPVLRSFSKRYEAVQNDVDQAWRNIIK